MNVVFDYRPLPKYVDFHCSRAWERSLFGGYGSGKTKALCAEAIAFGLEQQGSEILIARKHIPALRDTTEAMFVSLLPPKFLEACTVRRAGGHLESVFFPNGSKFMFRGMDMWEKHKSMNLALIAYDEADELDFETYSGMMSRVRQRQPTPEAKAQGAGPITRRGIISASNPAGHNWLWDRFVSEKSATGTEWFKSTSLDNPHLPIETLKAWLEMPEPWVRRYVLCSFDEFAGQIYESWAWDTHVVAPYKNLQGLYEYDPQGFFVMGFDPGTASGNAAIWVYHDKAQHRLVGVAEYNERGLAASVHADAWRKIEARHRMRVRTRVADPAAVTVRDRGTNMALSDQYRRLGFAFQLGPRAIDARLYPLGELIHNKRFVVTNECPQTYEQILSYRYEDLTPTMREKGGEPKPLKKNVDLVDAAQYVASRYIDPPKIAKPRTDKEQFAFEVTRNIRRQLQNRTATSGHALGTMAV